MAKTKREIIIVTFIVSCAATVLSIVAMATEEWVKADIKPKMIGLEKAEVNYGLFGGTFLQYYLTTNTRQTKIAIACIIEENICGFCVALTGDGRIKELKNILNADTCKNTETIVKYLRGLNNQHDKEETNDIEYHEWNPNLIEVELLDNTNKTDSMKYTKVKRELLPLAKDDSTSTTNIPDINIPQCDPTFLNGGLWITTTFCLSLSIMLSASTAVLSVVNTAGNPISPWFNIWGLYIWNGSSSVFLLLTMIFWGIEFALMISYNVGVSFTLNGLYENDSASLGFSYWLIFAPLFLHIVNIGLFYYRQYLIEQEPEINEEKIDTADRDGMIFVY